MLADDAFVLRFFGKDGNDRLLLVNLGVDALCRPHPSRCFASPFRIKLELLWSSEDPRYGGYGAVPIGDEMRWFLPEKSRVPPDSGKVTNSLLRKVTFSPGEADEIEKDPEWLVANGLGGYASGTVSGAARRRYHGLLIAALPAPLGRVLMLNGLAEELHLSDGQVVELNAIQSEDRHVSNLPVLSEFRLDMGLPIWRYQIDDVVLEKRLYLPYRQNTVHITYRSLSHGGKIGLRLRPLIQFREHEAAVDSQPEAPYVLTVVEDQYEISSRVFPALRLLLYGKGDFVIERKRIERLRYILEETRGYTTIGDLWSPGSFVVDCSPAKRSSWPPPPSLGKSCVPCRPPRPGKRSANAAGV